MKLFYQELFMFNIFFSISECLKLQELHRAAFWIVQLKKFHHRWWKINCENVLTNSYWIPVFFRRMKMFSTISKIILCFLVRFKLVENEIFIEISTSNVSKFMHWNVKYILIVKNCFSSEHTVYNKVEVQRNRCFQTAGLIFYSH